MSWSFDYTGTPAGVKAAVTKFCNKSAESYKGTQEAVDVLMVRDRVCALVDALQLGQDGYTTWNACNAKGNGSHSATGANILSANASFAVVRTVLVLEE